MPIRCFLRLKGIDDFEKPKTVKVSISSADRPDSVLAHEDGCMRVVQQVARKVRNFSENLLRDYRMLLCRYQNVEAWRGKQRLYEVPSLRHIPRSSHHGIRQICTRDADFHRFPFLEVIDPLQP